MDHSTWELIYIMLDYFMPVVLRWSVKCLFHKIFFMQHVRINVKKFAREFMYRTSYGKQISSKHSENTDKKKSRQI